MNKKMIIRLKNRRLSPENNNQEGQALLFVVVALTVALAVGISTAFRTLSSVSRVTTTDTSVRVLAAAEGGLEHFLSYTTPELNAVLGTCNSLDSTNPACIVTFTPIATDNITARAIVMVEQFRGGEASDNYRYRTNIPVGDSITINLSGFSGNLHVCWQGESDLFYNYYNGTTMSNWNQGVLCPQTPGDSCYSGSSNVSGSGIISATTPPAACSSLGSNFHGYTFNNILLGSPGTLRKGLVLTALNSDVAIAVQNGDGVALFPQILGYKITSRGELLENATVKTTKTTSVVRSLPYLSPNLIFGLFADSGIDSLNTYMDLGTSPTCALTGDSCTSLPCCSVDDSCFVGTCVNIGPPCIADGVACDYDTNCCNGCVSGVCGGGAGI